MSGEWSRKAHERARGNQVVSDEAQPRPPAWNLVQCREAESERRRCRYAKANFGGLRNGKSQLRSEGAAARQQAEPCRKRGFGLQTARETGSARPRLRGQLAKGATQILHTLRIADAFVRCVERQVQCSSGRHQNLYRDPGDIHRLGLRRKHPPDIARCDTNAPKAPMEIDSGVISRSLPGTGGGIPLIGHRVDEWINEAQRRQDFLGDRPTLGRHQNIAVNVAAPGAAPIQPEGDRRPFEKDARHPRLSKPAHNLCRDQVDGQALRRGQKCRTAFGGGLHGDPATFIWRTSRASSSCR